MKRDLEDIPMMVQQALDAIDVFEERPDDKLAAADLEMTLTLLKLQLGNERFNGLPSFVRYLQKASAAVSAAKEADAFKQAMDSFAKVEDGVLKLGSKL